MRKTPMDGSRVLVVEDNPINQKVVSHFLARQGFEVDVAENGAVAVRACASRPYDVILMDCNMPVMDGYTATGEIRQLQGARQRTPIIAVTANTLDGERDRCLRAGMDDYLAKPLDLALLRTTIAAWLCRRPSTG